MRPALLLLVSTVIGALLAGGLIAWHHMGLQGADISAPPEFTQTDQFAQGGYTYRQNPDMGFSMISKRKILKINLTKRERTEKNDVVAKDKPINIFVNGTHFVTLMASPKNIKELAIGHLLGEGTIKTLEDLERVSVKGVNVNLRTKAGIRLEVTKSLKFISTACGAPQDITKLLGKLGIPGLKSTKFKAKNISNSFRSLQLSSNIFRRTGGAHAAALFAQDGELKFCLEDVGRHNAVDKVLGKGLIEGVDFTRSFLVSTGRLSADVVIKCIRAGIPLVASKAAPLESGVLAAEVSGLTLVGFLRGSQLNIYAHPGRVEI